MIKIFTACTFLAAGLSGWADTTVDPDLFENPPAPYRPIVSIDEGAAARPLLAAARRALLEDGAGGIMFNPTPDPARRARLKDQSLRGLRPHGLQHTYPDTASPWLMKALPGEAGVASFIREATAPEPDPAPASEVELGYLTPQWFREIEKVLALARENGRFATFYDEAGFPSGMADHTTPAKFRRKLLRREEITLSAYQPYPVKSCDEALAVIAVNVRTGERIDPCAAVEPGDTTWYAPYGSWRVQKYFVATATPSDQPVDYYGAVDYFDEEAVRWFIDRTYARVRERLGDYFGSTIDMTFFDDVGIYSDEKTWHPAIAERFEKITGRKAATYYPALWQDIGPETSAARVGFFKARAELLGEGSPRLVTEWTRAHGVHSSGHAPGNYNVQPTDMNGDPFEFYAYTDIPMADVIFGHGFGRDGFKLISSVSYRRDLPITAAETFTAYNSDRGYRRLIELYVRGINRFITGGRHAKDPRGTPREFNEWAGRQSLLLQGGRHVADIAVVYPIASLQAFYAFDAPDNSAKLPSGMHVYRDADYLAVGEMLVSSLHRDFTFVHPDALAGDELQVDGDALVLMNEVNRERYRVVVLPGGKVISVPALTKIKQYYDAGGRVIATSLLPSKSAEFGQDERVQAMIREMFGRSPDEEASHGPAINRNATGGQAVFVPHPDPAVLGSVLDELELTPDVAFRGNPTPTSGNGVFGYLHMQKEGKHIYYFGNSTDQLIDTVVTLRGRIDSPQIWNPHDGSIAPAQHVHYKDTPAGVVTELDLKVPPVSSLFVVGHR